MEHNSFGSVKGLLDKYNIKLSKATGQNFLIDANIPDKIVRLSGIDSSCGVLEVGPGAGALTAVLCRTAGKVTAVELDTRLIPLLRDILKEHKNFELVHGDILKLDIKQIVEEKMPGLKHHVCANLPYNITTPVLAAFIEAGIFGSITVMVQREVARRICARQGTPEYSAFTVYSNYHTEPEILFDVPPECFMPRPKVYSSVLRMKTRDERALSREKEQIFFRVVRAAFSQRRKTLVNSLHAVFYDIFNKDELSGIVTKCGFDARVRGEALDIGDFIKIASFFG